MLTHVWPSHCAHKMWCFCHWPWKASPVSLKSCLINSCGKLGVSKTEPFNPITARPPLHGTCDYLHLSTFKSLIDTWPRSQCQCKSDGPIYFYSTHWMFDWVLTRDSSAPHPVLIRSFCVVIQRINRKPPRNRCLLRDSKHRGWFLLAVLSEASFWFARLSLSRGPSSCEISSRSSGFSDRW